MRSALPKSTPQQSARDWRQEFQDAHERYGIGLRRFFSRRAGSNAEQVEELLQQTWVEVWKSLQQGRYLPERAALSTFVYAVANKHWLRVRRELGTRKRPVGDIENLLADWINPESGPDDVTAVSELLSALRDCIRDSEAASALTPEELSIVNGVMQGITERQLAQTLQVAPSTAHGWKRSALMKLRRCLTEKGFPAGEQAG